MVCGTQFPLNNVPELCIICNDERQYIPESGQTWTNLVELSKSHRVIINKIDDCLYELKTVPVFGIGQRALFILTHDGNILWDCISLLDEATVEWIKSKGCSLWRYIQYCIQYEVYVCDVQQSQ